MFKGAICRLVNVRCFAVRCFCCKIFELHRIQMLYFRHPSFDSVLFYRRRRMHKACIISALWVERRKDWTLRRWASRRRNCRQPSLALEVTHERGHARCCFVGSAALLFSKELVFGCIDVPGSASWKIVRLCRGLNMRWSCGSNRDPDVIVGKITTMKFWMKNDGLQSPKVISN